VYSKPKALLVLALFLFHRLSLRRLFLPFLSLLIILSSSSVLDGSITHKEVDGILWFYSKPLE